MELRSSYKRSSNIIPGERLTFLTFSAELALLLAAAGAGRAFARALVLALPASDQHFPQPPSQGFEGGVIESDAGAGAGRAAGVHKAQMARGRAIRAGCGSTRSTNLIRRVSAARHRRLVAASSIVDERETCRLYRIRASETAKLTRDRESLLYSPRLYLKPLILSAISRVPISLRESVKSPFDNYEEDICY